MSKRTPLPVLMSHALHAFSRDYVAASKELPSLPILNNVLRVIGPRGVHYKQIGRLSILSERVVRVSTRLLENKGWLTTDSAGARSDQVWQLTPQGKRARTRGRRRQTATEQSWEKKFGRADIQNLRSALTSIVNRVDVELPHHIVGYGQGDPSITGGGYIPAEVGPPKIPGHGQEWPIVVREDKSSVATLPLMVLLSQALAAFTIDYDEGAESVMGGLHGVTRFLLSVGKDGMPLSEASKIAEVNGSGRAALERHRLVVVEVEKGARGNQRTVFLTERGRRVCERFPGRVVEIERQWQGQYGSKVVNTLRSVLESLDQQLDGDFPDYPETRDWIQRKRAS